MGSLSIWHWLLVILVVVLLFGRGKISDLMGDMAKGIKSFKKGLADDSDQTGEVKAIDQKQAEEAAKAGREGQGLIFSRSDEGHRHVRFWNRLTPSFWSLRSSRSS